MLSEPKLFLKTRKMVIDASESESFLRKLEVHKNELQRSMAIPRRREFSIKKDNISFSYNMIMWQYLIVKEKSFAH